MRIDRAELYALHIPFRLDFVHSQAKRLASDSFVFAVSAGSAKGYGEGVVRDYVSGSMEDGGGLESAANTAGRMLQPLLSTDLNIASVHEWSASIDPPNSELPILCAVETALLDLLCAIEGTDIYSLLKTEPVHQTLTYGGTVPILHPKAAEAIIQLYKGYEISNLRLKLGNDLDQNRSIVGMARAILGDGFDLRVDANGAWGVNEAFENLAMLSDFGISLVEEPFGRDEKKIKELIDDGRSDGFTFVADESVLSHNDLEQIAGSGTYSMINIRLSKNGGLLRSLSLDKTAAANNITTQLGCHVGETGILSATGRVAASFMAKPVYVDGSYDEYLLSDNVTEQNLSFRRGGLADIIRGEGVGFTVDETALGRLTYEHCACI